LIYCFLIFFWVSSNCVAEVAPDWLACFPSGAPRWLFDEFFLQAPVTEALFELAPSLSSDHLRVEDTEDELDGSAVVCAQARRLILFLSLSLSPLFLTWWCTL
jgi:hypothetical protein